MPLCCQTMRSAVRVSMRSPIAVIYFVDTNILLRFADRTHPLHPRIRAAVRVLRTEGHRLQATPQNCIEFWNVADPASRQERAQLGACRCRPAVTPCGAAFPVLPDVPAVYPQWRQLVVAFGVSGVQVHVLALLRL